MSLAESRKMQAVRLTMAAAALFSVVTFVSSPAAHAADKTTKYRVYQNDQLLKEFSDLAQARSYAQQYAHSRVEDIGSHEWVWNNFPRYRVYQLDVTLPDWEFTSLQDAINEAKKWSHASVRDLQSSGWVWNNYPKYRVVQGDSIHLDWWDYQTLGEAQAEASKWAGSHVIDLRTNEWVWDNIGADEKARLRAGTPVYKVYQGTYSGPDWTFASLEDAVHEALKWAGAKVVKTSENNKVVFDTTAQYTVYQSDNKLANFVSLDDAIRYAQLWAYGNVRLGSRTIWTSIPTYLVYQSNKEIGGFSTIPEALHYAVQYADASIRNETGQSIWSNFRKLQYWGWNGVSNWDTIKTQVSPTQGLDVDSPSWFTLADASGNLKDTSTKDAADSLKKLGYAVYPLVSNQFDSALTTAFLANATAQDTFISKLVGRSVQLGITGINIDFESVNGKDRKAFTSFMRKLTDAAHAKGLTVSIDLPRGSVKWNAQTAFDHEALGEIVDYVVSMAYDQFYSASPSPGSVSGLPWAEQGIQEFLSYGIPREKLILGIPLYIREWTLDASGNLISNRAIYTKDVNSILNGKATKMTWDDTFQQYKIEYNDGGNHKVLWMENDDTLKARLEIAKKYEIAGVAMWRLGQEPAGFWNTLIQNK